MSSLNEILSNAESIKKKHSKKQLGSGSDSDFGDSSDS